MERVMHTKANKYYCARRNLWCPTGDIVLTRVSVQQSYVRFQGAPIGLQQPAAIDGPRQVRTPTLPKRWQARDDFCARGHSDRLSLISG